MKMVAILGSPRSKGNSAFLARKFLEAAKKAGAQTAVFELNQLEFRGCQACMACKTGSETCVLKDDLAPVLEAVREADVVVLASPVYFGEVTAQMKAFIDRTFCYLTPEFRTRSNRSRLRKGKTMVFVQTQGAPPAIYGELYSRYETIMKYHNCDRSFLIRGCELSEPTDASNRPDVLKQIELAVQAVLGNGG